METRPDTTVPPAEGDEAEIDAILRRAAAAGLSLTADEARQLVTGVRRIREMAAEVRALVTDEVEPSGSQVAPIPPGSRPAAGR